MRCCSAAHKCSRCASALECHRRARRACECPLRASAPVLYVRETLAQARWRGFAGGVWARPARSGGCTPPIRCYVPTHRPRSTLPPAAPSVRACLCAPVRPVAPDCSAWRPGCGPPGRRARLVPPAAVDGARLAPVRLGSPRAPAATAAARLDGPRLTHPRVRRLQWCDWPQSISIAHARAQRTQ
jgi:hypothetical protein